MSFSVFGKINYISETKVSDFVKYLEAGKIMATRCRRCGKLYFPPRAHCPNDLSEDMAWEELSGKCKLLTYTTLNFAPTGFEDDIPYTLAVAQLEEGVNVYTRLSKDIKSDEIKVGMELRLTPVLLPNGKLSYELKKIES
ncbi:MAG: Zn-ribbon domain-containing OB-fold protein [Nitrososphaerota archaeon]|nr:Zn-ribbon domain-containing OB-fold protein [Candidatus Bathyarchaeota archaeon]MDW8022731.1 Zn-ribbon domain-containing OB-fold protein [Nitrososphaerota archaeon]